MDHQNSHHIPLLSEVMRSVAPLPAETTVQEVAGIFRANPGLLMLPLCRDRNLEGTISRRELFSHHLAKAYAMELYGKKPVSVLMNDRPLLMAPESTVSHALERLLAADPGLDTDSFPLVDEQGYVGIVHVAEMIMAISKAQAFLLDTLELLTSRIRTEVEKARQIQQQLLPPSSLVHAGLEVSACLINSTEISGDFYDYFIIDDQRMGVAIGDVSGHGVQSGMVTTAAKAGLQLLLETGIHAPGALLAGMNTAVLATASNTLLMTAVVAIIDTRNNTLSLANAGHNYPYLYRSADACCCMLDGTGGFPLGFDKGSEYAELEVAFHPGDRLLLYTDGIIEARNDDTQEEFGNHRLESHISAAIAGDPDAFRRSLVALVSNFTGADHFEDDVSIVVVANECREKEGTAS
jgi:serine phosphatase RsbU (regulator of sigma subunit)